VAVILKGSEMENIATSPKGIPEEILDRVLIALFLGLCLLLGNTLLTPVKDGVLYASFAALLELFIIQAMRGFFGNTPLVRDANELNFYSFLIHLIVIPFILYGAQTDWHNYAINGMVVFYLARLLYFGERQADGEFTGWAKFGALAWTTFFIEKAANTVTKQRVFFAVRILITLATIVPLWVITAQTNDQTTSLYTVLTTSFILIYGYVKHIIASRKRSQSEALLNDETIALCQAYNARSSDARQVIQRIVVEEFSGPTRTTLAPAKSDSKNTTAESNAELAAAKAEIKNLKECLWLAALMIFAGFLIGAMVVKGEGQEKFSFGYAFGFADGKNGVAPKAEVRLERLAKCYNRGNSGHPEFPDPACKDVFEAEPPKK
jgi:hypothetical protein